MCIVVNPDHPNEHKCFENSFKQNCATCLEPLWDCVDPVSILLCNNVMHKSCFQELLDADYRCPICKKAVVDMSMYWMRIDDMIEEAAQVMENEGEELPEQLATKIEKIACHECETDFEAKFSPFNYYKCPTCGGYNTALV